MLHFGLPVSFSVFFFSPKQLEELLVERSIVTGLLLDPGSKKKDRDDDPAKKHQVCLGLLLRCQIQCRTVQYLLSC